MRSAHSLIIGSLLSQARCCAAATVRRSSLGVVHRRSALQLAGTVAGVLGLAPIATNSAVHAEPLKTVYDGASGVKLSRAQIEGKLAKIPCVALVNPQDAPYLDSRSVGYFYLDPKEALLALRILRKTEPEARLKVVTLPEVYYPLVRGEQPNIGGELRLRPSRRQIVYANRALQYSGKPGALLPTSLDEDKGQVPIFYSEQVAFEINKEVSFPFFLNKEDLDAAFYELKGSTGVAQGTAGDSNSPPPPLPVGLLRVATLDGLLGQMERGDIDLSQAVLVGSKDALVTIQQLLRDAL